MPVPQLSRWLLQYFRVVGERRTSLRGYSAAFYVPMGACCFRHYLESKAGFIAGCGHEGLAVQSQRLIVKCHLYSRGGSHTYQSTALRPHRLLLALNILGQYSL